MTSDKINPIVRPRLKRGEAECLYCAAVYLLDNDEVGRDAACDWLGTPERVQLALAGLAKIRRAYHGPEQGEEPEDW